MNQILGKVVISLHTDSSNSHFEFLEYGNYKNHQSTHYKLGL